MISSEIDRVFHWPTVIKETGFEEEIYEQMKHPPAPSAEIHPDQNWFWWRMRRLWPPHTKECPKIAYAAFKATAEGKDVPFEWLTVTFLALYQEEWGWPTNIEEFVNRVGRIEDLTAQDADKVREWILRRRLNRQLSLWLQTSQPSIGAQPISKPTLLRAGLRPKAKP